MKTFKIIFCIVLVVAIAFGVMGLRLGKNNLDASVEKVMNTEDFKDLYLDNSLFYRFEGFGFTWMQFKEEFIENYENCYSQRMKISLTNKNDFDITVLGIEVKEGGDGIYELYFSVTPEKTVTVPANCTEEHSVWFPIMSIGPDKNDTLEIVQKNVSLKLIYADASKNIQSLAEASEDDLIYEWIR